jgi:hypothetical protein
LNAITDSALPEAREKLNTTEDTEEDYRGPQRTANVSAID